MTILMEKFLGIGRRTQNQKDKLLKKYELAKEGITKRQTMATNAEGKGKIGRAISKTWNTGLAKANLGIANKMATKIKDQSAVDESRARAAEIKQKYADLKNSRTASKPKKDLIDVKTPEAPKVEKTPKVEETPTTTKEKK